VQYLIFPHLVGPQHGWRMDKNRASRITRNKEIISFILGRRPLLREIDLECCRYSRKDRDSISPERPDATCCSTLDAGFTREIKR
jgi:hypothetical protein